MIDRENFILLTDSYKMGHWKMLLDGTQNVGSYFESRTGAKYPTTSFFGLQAYLKRYFVGVVITQQDIEEADLFCKEHFGMDLFNRKMWERIVNVHGGKLPLRIKAVPEGSAVPVNNVLFTVEVTDEQCKALVEDNGNGAIAPLTNGVESLLTHVWASSNVSTISRDIRKCMEKAFEISADTNNVLPFMLHDFGFRGVSSVESAGMAGMGHLSSGFMGTDTMQAIVYGRRYYNTKAMLGFSVPATEHSVMTPLGAVGERKIAEMIIDRFPDGILSMVSDSFNIIEAIKVYGTILKEKIVTRNGKFVVRPDSPRFKGDKACDQIVWIAKELEKYFGASKNKKGYKTLHPKVGIIYGDGLSADEIKESVWALVAVGFSAETCVFGMGGGLLQKHNRDTQRSAFKCSAQKRDDVWYDVQKIPLDVTKASKAGRLKLVNNGNNLKTVKVDEAGDDFMQTVFLNGEIVKEYTFEEVRANSLVDYI